MAIVSGTAPNLGFHYGDTSVVTDVTDFIFQITPEDKPFFHMCGDKATVQAPVHEWQQRNLTTREDNAQLEGFVYTFSSPLRLPTRQTNVLQILGRDIRISGTNQAIGHYGIPSMTADQVEVQLGELGTDIEVALLVGTIATSGTAATARRMKGMIQALMSGITGYTNASGSTLNETLINTHLELGWQRGTALRDALVDGRVKRIVSQYSGNAGRFIPADDMRLVNSIDVYESDFGPVSMHLCRDIPNFFAGTTLQRAILFVDKTHLQKAWLRGVGVEKTAKIADSEDYILKTELTLEFGHPAAHLFLRATPQL